MKDILKAGVIILMMAVTFYLVYPKYEFHPKRVHIVINKITGSVHEWE